MKIRIFKLRRRTLDDGRYEDITEHGCHPNNEEVRASYKELSPIIIDAKLGDIIEVDGIRYFYAPSGIEVHEPIA